MAALNDLDDVAATTATAAAAAAEEPGKFAIVSVQRSWQGQTTRT